MNYLLRKIIQKVDGVIGIVTGRASYVNGEYLPEHYFPEVRMDIKILRAGLKDAKFERSRNDNFQGVARKYREKYCPCEWYGYFSLESELEYLGLREEIDELLSLDEQEIVA